MSYEMPSHPVAAEIPMIDLQGLVRGDPAAVGEVAAQIRSAALGTGFFYIRNHGIPDDVIDGAFEANRRFHARPLDEKLKLQRNAWHRGYSHLGASTIRSTAKFAPVSQPNHLAAINFRHEVDPADPSYCKVPLQGPNQWPDDADFVQAIRRYDAALRELGVRLLRPLSVAVGEAAEFFDPFFERATTNMRLLHYPPAPPRRPEDLLGIHPHTDYGFLTILAQDPVGGLQVRRLDGSWIDAVHIPGTFVINIGDALARWTNDVFNSTPHRVISPTESRDRYSIPYFFDPDFEAELGVLPPFVTESRPARYEPVRFGAYLSSRLDENHPNRTSTVVAPEQPVTVER